MIFRPLLYSALLLFSSTVYSYSQAPVVPPTAVQNRLLSDFEDYVILHSRSMLTSSPRLDQRFGPFRSGISTDWYSNSTYDGSFDSAFRPRSWSMWSESSYFEGKESVDDEESHSFFAHGAFDYRVSSNIILGTLFQYDEGRRESANSEATNEGWLVSQYFTRRVGINTTFEGKIAYGQSETMITLDNTTEELFDTYRLSGQLKYTGSLPLGRWDLRPEFSYQYYSEHPDSDIVERIPSIKGDIYRIHRIDFGPSIVHRYGSFSRRTITVPYLSLKGVWDFVDIDRDSRPTVESENDITMRVSAGIRSAGRSGLDFNLDTFYDAIDSDHERYGVKMSLGIHY